MFWTRLYLLLISTVAALAVAVLMVAAQPFAGALDDESGQRLERAQQAAALFLKVNARQWMDLAAHDASDAVLVEALGEATRGPADLAILHKTVQERLRAFADKSKLDLVWATDGKGRVIARAGLDDNVYKDGLEGVPLVGDALRGLRGDDTWSRDGKLYRVAASPVMGGGRYVGALILGQEAGAALTQTLKKMFGVEVAFLLRGRVVAASTQTPVVQQLPMVLGQKPLLNKDSRTSPLEVRAGEDRYLAVAASFVGEAAGHQATYVLLVPRPPTLTPAAILTQLLRIDPRTLPWMSLAPVGGALLVLLILGLVLLRVEATRPISRLMRDTQMLARGEIARLSDGAHPGPLGAVARAINTTLDRLGSRQHHAHTPLPPPKPATREEKQAEAMVRALRPPSVGSAPLPPKPEEPKPEEESPELMIERAMLQRLDEHTSKPLALGPDPLPMKPIGDARPKIFAPLEEDVEAPTKVGGPVEDEDPLEVEMRGVFAEFLETKQSCGEPTDGVTYDKFAEKLRANRAQLIAKYSCKGVKFQVYIKDGKAALKATPQS